MMQAMKFLNTSLPGKWYILAGTTSTSSTMAFDRLRLSNNSNVQVAIMNPADSANYQGTIGSDELGSYLTLTPNEVQQIQPFHSGNGWTTTPDEHDFSFDCSGFVYGNGNSDSAPILIRNITLSSIFWQLYAYPTGYGGTRNKNAELELIDYRTLRIGTVGTEIGRLRLTNQGVLHPYEQITLGKVDNSPVNAKEVRLEGTSTGTVRYMLEMLVLGGETDGTLSYTESERPKSGTQEAIDDYDTLISRNWSITGGRPS